MKKHLIFCIALAVVMASCVKEPQIYRLLSDEEAAVVPYRMGQSLKMRNQDGDTLCLTVVHDTTFLACNYYEYHGAYNGKTSIEPQPYFYMREVVLQGLPEDSCLFRFQVGPKKVISISFEKRRYIHNAYGDNYYWNTIFEQVLDLLEIPTTTFTLGDTEYENVHFTEGTYWFDTALVSYSIHYSETYGLLSAKGRNYSLTLIP